MTTNTATQDRIRAYAEGLVSHQDMIRDILESDVSYDGVKVNAVALATAMFELEGLLEAVRKADVSYGEIETAVNECAFSTLLRSKTDEVDGVEMTATSWLHGKRDEDDFRVPIGSGSIVDLGGSQYAAVFRFNTADTNGRISREIQLEQLLRKKRGLEREIQKLRN